MAKRNNDSARNTEPISPVLQRGHARLTVLAGECPHGMTFSLAGGSHDAGRDAEIALTEDPTVSPKHATFAYRGESLEVTDKGSLNGVYVRIRGPRPLQDGDWFRVGGQYFRFDLLPQDETFPTEDGTLLSTSPRRAGSFRVLQILDGGKTGLSSTTSSDELSFGGQGATVVFTADPYLSNEHARIARNPSGGFSIEDLGSTNGTFVRVKGSEPLENGDLVYLGNTLIRVDVTA